MFMLENSLVYVSFLEIYRCWPNLADSHARKRFSSKKSSFQIEEKLALLYFTAHQWSTQFIETERGLIGWSWPKKTMPRVESHQRLRGSLCLRASKRAVSTAPATSRVPFIISERRAVIQANKSLKFGRRYVSFMHSLAELNLESIFNFTKLKRMTAT